MPKSRAISRSLALLLCSAACDDAGVSSTLVRYQGGKPNASWNLELTRDAGRDDEDAGLEPDEPKAAAACKFRVTTRAQGGRYAPKNIGAIWIEREDGTWVKTLKVWAGVRLRYLTTYLEANTKRDTTDAITSATLRQHASHEVNWALHDEPDGDYRVRVEVTDRSGDGQLLSVPFSKSNGALKASPGDSEFFVDVALDCS